MTDVGSARGPQSRRIVAGMGRAELEDKHLSLLEENHLLKKHARSQEEKMKKMATKLLKLAADERKEARREGQPPSVVQVRELEGEMQELVCKIRDLQRTNSSLQNRIAVLRLQCESKGKRRTAYDHIQSRISSGPSRRGQQRSVSTEDVSLRRAASAHSSPNTPRYGRSLLEEARRDNQQLEELVVRLKQDVSVLTAEVEKSQEQMRLQAAEREHERLSLEQQLKAHSTTQQKRGIEEDVEVIRMQREMREKSDRLLVLQTQYSALEKNLEAMRATHSKLLQEIEQLNSRLKEEHTHSIDLQSQLHSSSVSHRTVVELQQMVDDLRTEKDLLKKTNDRLMKSAVMEDRGSEYKGEVRVLQGRIRELETAQQIWLTTGAHTTHGLSSEREVMSKKLEQKLQESHEIYHHIPTQHHQLMNRLYGQESSKVSSKSGTKDAAVNTDHVPPTLPHPTTTATATAAAVTVDPLSFLEKLEPDGNSDLHHELSELRLSHVDTAAELEKTRQLLAAQRAINQDYRKEVEALQDQVCQLQSQQSAQHSGQSRLLSEQAALVRQLQSQLRDSDYDTGKLTQLQSADPPLSPSSYHTHPQPTLHSSHKHKSSHKHTHSSGHCVAVDTDISPHSASGGCDDTVDEGRLTGGRDRGQERRKTRGDGKLQKKRKQFSDGKREEKCGRAVEKRSANLGIQVHEGVTVPHTQSKRQSKTSQLGVMEVKPKTEDTVARETPAEEQSKTGLQEPLPPLRTTGGVTSPLGVVVQQDPRENDREGRDSEQLTESEMNHSLEEVPGEDGARDEDEESITEDISSSHSSSGMGTPSTSTPLRPALPLPASSSGSSSRQDSVPPPPFSSSLSVIAEPPAAEVEGVVGEGGRGKRGRVKGEEGGDGGGEVREVVMVGGGEEVMGTGEDGDSVSVTVTEMSDEGDDDTMFEETLPQHTLESIMSGRTITTPTQPSIRLASDDEEESPLISPSLTSGDDEAPITPSTPQPKHLAAQAVEDVMSITVVSFTVVPGCSLTIREDISGYFVEFQLLDYDYGELETPSVFTSPHSTQPVVFNHRADLQIGPSQKALLSSALKSSADNFDRKVIFIVVSDPVDQEGDCQEVGTAELDLATILHCGEDPVSKNIEVMSCDEETELLGHLTVSVDAIHILQHL